MRSHATHSRQSCKKIMLLLFPLLRSQAMTQIVSPVLRAKPAVFLSTAADRTIRSVCYGNSVEPTNDIVYGLWAHAWSSDWVWSYQLLRELSGANQWHRVWFMSSMVYPTESDNGWGPSVAQSWRIFSGDLMPVPQGLSFVLDRHNLWRYDRSPFPVWRSPPCDTEHNNHALEKSLGGDNDIQHDRDWGTKITL